AVEMRLELHAFLGNGALLREAENLKASAVGQNGTVPSDEAMQASQVGDQLRPRSKHQVIGVAEDDLRPQARQIIRADRLDCPCGSHGHEGRSFYAPVRSAQSSAPSLRLSVAVQELKFNRACAHERVSQLAIM